MNALSEAEREVLADACDAMYEFGETWVRFIRNGSEDVLIPAVERILAAHADALRVETLRQAAEELRRQGVERMCVAGPHDARGAALWDAGCHIDPENGDALRVGRKALDERPAT